MGIVYLCELHPHYSFKEVLPKIAWDSYATVGQSGLLSENQIVLSAMEASKYCAEYVSEESA